MTKINSPLISETDDSDSISLSFIPSYKLLNMSSNPMIDDENKLILYKRVYDMTHLGVDIMLNDEVLPKMSWSDFVESHSPKTKFWHYETNRWKVSFGCSNGSFKQISFVNSIHTSAGGTHVKYIQKQISSWISSKIGEKNNGSPKNVKTKLFVVVYAIIEDPIFMSQSKECLSLSVEKFGSKCVIPNNLLKDFLDNSDIKTLLNSKIINEHNNLIGKTKVTSIDHLTEANKAGSNVGYKCTLFLCEGSSAKTMCETGIGVIGHDFYGCYALRGKVLNVRNSSINKYFENKELNELKIIVGLKDGEKYNEQSVKKLRYGKIVCVKDADSDGAAIMGLLINFFMIKFPTLLTIKGFFSEFITPMIIQPYGKSLMRFYNMVEHKLFIESKVTELKNLPKAKYIKGLASNKKPDVVDYFKHYNDNCLNIMFDVNGTQSAETENVIQKIIETHNNNKEDNELEDNDIEFENIEFQADYSFRGTNEVLDLVYNTKRANERKSWLINFDHDSYLKREASTPIHCVDFINNDVASFSIDALVRSIPQMIDGLKPTQRKILYVLFGMPDSKAYTPMKVAQLTGAVSKDANYHHGEASMSETIINMAQTYVGSNNVPLLDNDQGEGFGTRIDNGNDTGAPRYIFCSLHKIARLIFPKEDDPLLERVIDDNEEVEPTHYVPIVPFILFNGTIGIGTGWSTTIPSFNPIQIIDYVINSIMIDPVGKIESYYRGFEGDVIELKNGWEYKGKFRLDGQKCFVEELPINYSTNCFISRLNYLTSGVVVAGSKNKVYWSPEIKVLKYNNHTRDNDHPKFDITFDYDFKFEKTIVTGKTKQTTKKVSIPKPTKTTKKPKIDEPKIVKAVRSRIVNLDNQSENSKTTNSKTIVPKLIVPNTALRTRVSTNEVQDSTNKQSEAYVSEVLGMSTQIRNTNMVLLDINMRPKRYSSQYEIIDDWIPIRRELYVKRKEYNIRKMEIEITKLKNMCRFIKEDYEGLIKIRRVPKNKLIETLIEREYDTYNDTYEYLLNITISQLTMEKYNSLLDKFNKLNEQYEQYISTYIEEIWINELNDLKIALMNLR